MMGWDRSCDTVVGGPLAGQNAFFKYRFLKGAQLSRGRGGFDKKKFNLETPKIQTVKFPQKVASDEIPSKYRRHTSALRVIDIRLAGIAANGEAEIE